jgi:DNA invertase Pin-like site-specific DNA recombinase
MPEADNLTIHLMTAVAEREAQWISAHTKAALAARKARGSSSANTLTDQLRTPIKSGAATMKDGRLTAVPHLGETVA